jgi:hypothetical protein
MKPIPAAIACLALVLGSAAWSLDGRGPAAVDTDRHRLPQDHQPHAIYGRT